jgi:hypothetical protein
VLRLSREEKALDIPDDASAVLSPSVKKALEGTGPPPGSGEDDEENLVPLGDEMPETGDDDDEDLDTIEAEETGLVGDDDFYSDALGDA